MNIVKIVQFGLKLMYILPTICGKEQYFLVKKSLIYMNRMIYGTIGTVEEPKNVSECHGNLTVVPYCLVKKVYNNGRQYNYIAQLECAMQTDWNYIIINLRQKLVQSMRNPCVSFLQRNGYETNY